MSSGTLATGFACGKCGHYMPFSAWAYAHWDEGFFATCVECGTRHSVTQGKAKVVYPKPTPEERRQDLRAACSERGYELVWSDLRTGEFHLRKGSEVLSGRLSRQAQDAGPAVNKAILGAVRLDQVASSRYFAGVSNG